MKANNIVALLFVFASGCWAQNNKGMFKYAVPTPLKNNQIQVDSLIQNNMKVLEKSKIILFPWKQIDGSYGILPVLIVNDNDTLKKQMVFNYNETHDHLEKRLTLMKEIVEYHKAIKKAELELAQLKEERDRILKKLDYVKTKLSKCEKFQLNRLE